MSVPVMMPRLTRSHTTTRRAGAVSRCTGTPVAPAAGRTWRPSIHRVTAALLFGAVVAATLPATDPTFSTLKTSPHRLYGARTIKRSRRTRAQVEQLDAQIVAELRHDHPQSVRHVFYRQTDPRLPEPVEKSERGYRHVQRRCLELRRAGVVPYSWITDSSRLGYHVETFGNARDFVRRNASRFRADLWQHPSVPTYCEVWVESRSIAGMIRDVCRDLAVSLYPSGGFASASFAYAAAEGLNDQGNTTVLYIGDYDPAGVLIDVSIERELRRHLKPHVELTFERIGITEQQIAEHDLPTKPRKAGERRAQHIAHTVEAEAMPAHIMRELVRTRIEALLPAGLLETVRAAEESERALILEFADKLPRAS